MFNNGSDLHTLSKKLNLPWHRVINSKGEISIKDYESFNLQTLFLKSEGIKFNNNNNNNNTIDLNKYQFYPCTSIENNDNGL